jgi:hypothetical protein
MDLRRALESFVRWRPDMLETVAGFLVGCAFFVGLAIEDPRTPPAMVWAAMLSWALSLVLNGVRIQVKGQPRSELIAAYAAEVMWTFILAAALLTFFCGIHFLLERWYVHSPAIDWRSAWQWAVGTITLTTAYFAVVHSARLFHAAFSRSS